EILARLAHHAEAAGERQAVLEFAPAAARRASQLGAHREAAAQYARALRWADQISDHDRALLLEARALECYLTSQSAEAVDARLAAIGIWRKLGEHQREGDNSRLLSRAYWIDGRNAEAERANRQALSVLESLEPSLPLAWAYSNHAQLRMLSADNEEAIRAAERAL